jgi:hypothetical protein
MFEPAAAVAGAVLTIAMSALWVTVVLAVEVFAPGPGSVDVVETVAVFEIVPDAPGVMLTVIENVADVPFANDASVQVMVPVPPTEGVEQENSGPVVCDSETNVVFAGTASVRETLNAFDGPLLVRVTV